MRFEFKLLDPDSADAELDDGASQVTVPASFILDPLGNLLYALWRLMQGEIETRCSWVEEPGEYRWIMRREGDDVSLRILALASFFPSRPDEAGRLIFETRQDLRTFVRAIAMGASRTLGEHGESTYSDRMHAQFPTRILDLIKAELRTAHE